MKSVNFKVKTLSAIVAAGMVAAAGAASAQTVNGAGATLPQPLYEDIFSVSGANGVIGTWNYAGGGSGSGKSRFLTTTNTVHFAGSDSALSRSEVNTYNGSHRAAWGPLIQVPAVVTPVVLPYTRTGVSEVNLTPLQVCRIFAYHPLARTWGQILGTSDSTPIRVVYRSESSGTTELLSNFLTSSACSGLGFQKSTSFATVVSNAISGGIPSHWVAAEGSGGVSDAVATNGSFSYLSPSYDFQPDQASKVAKINGYLPSQVTFSAAAPSSNLDDPLSWVAAYPATTPTNTYPIYGTTNLLIGQCYTGGTGTGTVGAAIKDFLTKLNNGTYDSKITSNYFVKLPAAWNTAIRDAFLDSSSGLAIGNTSVCNGIGRPL